MSIIKTKELSKIGYTNDQARSLVINIILKHFKHHSKDDIIALLTSIKADPASYIADEIVGKIAAVFTGDTPTHDFRSYELRHERLPLKVYGGKHIESTAKQQMETVMSLPVAVQGALMPDAHAVLACP